MKPQNNPPALGFPCRNQGGIADALSISQKNPIANKSTPTGEEHREEKISVALSEGTEKS
jgi:hypothetical protein